MAPIAMAFPGPLEVILIERFAVFTEFRLIPELGDLLKLRGKNVHKRIPETVRPLLGDYIRLMEKELPGFMTAFYVCGSIALGAFNERLSDIDFIAVVSQRATEIEVENLRNLHQEIERRHPRWKMEGSYLQGSDLGCFTGEVEPYPYYYEGVLHPSGYHELNAITWWVLKNQGIAVVGPEPQELAFTVDWNLLITRMMENLNTYWTSWTQEPARIASLLTDEGVQWAVLGVLRQFYTFRENDIISKTAAGEYALSHVPTRWHRLIREAISIREHLNESYYNSINVRANEAIGFLKYVIESCNAHLITQVAT